MAEDISAIFNEVNKISPFLDLRFQWELTYEHTLYMANKDFIIKYINRDLSKIWRVNIGYR